MNGIKIITFILLNLMIIPLSYADDAPLVPTQSGNVLPIQHKSIQMVSERIDIDLYKHHYKVKVVYVFKNHGKSQSVIMGFPNRRRMNNSTTIENFKAYDGKKQLKVFQKGHEDAKKSNELGDPFFECTEVYFKKGEEKTILNTYSQKYLYDYDFSYNKMEYILKTGALWYKKIESIEVYIHFKGIAPHEAQSRSVLFWEKGLEEEKHSYKFSLSPNQYKFNKNRYEMHFKNIDPDFDIELTMPPPLINYAKASSTLKGKDSPYQAKNLFDNDPKTAWVEGNKSGGIGETFTIHFDSGRVITGAYYIDEIGFYNGFGKSKDLYYKNNRIKVLEMTYRDYKTEKIMTQKIRLKDTMKKQIIKLDKRIICFELQFKILEIYKGSQYNDTCLSEVMVYPLYFGKDNK